MANTKKYVSFDKLSLYDEKIKKVITDGDAASLQSAKDYADGLATNYDAAGAAATVQGKLDEEVARAKAAEEANAASAKKAQDEVDALELVVAEKAAQTDLDELSAYVGTIPEGATATNVVAYVQEKTAGIATSENLQELTNRVAQAETDIDNIEKDYLKAADKTELEGKIADAQGAVQGAVDALAGTHATDKKALEDAIALKADQTALDGVSAVANAAVKQADYDVKVKALEDEDARIEGLVTAEAAKAREEEGKLDARLEEVEAFFKLAEGEQLDEALDTLKELQVYVTTEGAAADQMVLDIAANAKAIEDHEKIDHDFAAADATLKSELEGKINVKADSTTVEAIDGRVTTAEGTLTTVVEKVVILENEMDAVEAAVATKADEQVLLGAIDVLEEADLALNERISELEAKFEGEGSVEDIVEAAKQEAIDTAAGDAETKANAAKDAAIAKANELNTAMDTRVAAVEAASATHALASDLTALTGRVTTAEGEIDTLQTEMDAVEALAAANKAAHEANAAAIALKASQADLEAVSGRVTTIETWHENFVEVSEEEINGLFA